MTMPRLGKPIAKGSTAEIYEWRPGEVLKLFYENRSQQEVRYEFQIANAVQVTASAPRVSEVIQGGGRWGIIYQHIQGTSLAEAIRNDFSNTLYFAEHFAKLHARIHTVHDVVGLPSQLERLKKKILMAPLLSTTLQQKVIAHLETLPTAHTLCHGDFHPGNVLISDNQFFIIDWADATLGQPLADVTRTVLILEGVKVAEPSLAVYIHSFKTAYLEHYFAVRSGSQDNLRLWRPVIAAARLREGIHQDWLLEQVNVGLAAL